MTGSFSEAWLVRIAFNRPKPSRTGIMTSAMTRSGGDSLMRSSATAPSCAVSTLPARAEEPGQVSAHIGVVVDDQNSRAARLVSTAELAETGTRQRLAHPGATRVRQPAHGFLDEWQSADSGALECSNVAEAFRRQVGGPARDLQCDGRFRLRASLRASTVPPWSFTSSCTSERPMPEPSCVRACGFAAAKEALKKARDIFWRNTATGVTHLQLDVFGERLLRHPYFALESELEGIGDQV